MILHSITYSFDITNASGIRGMEFQLIKINKKYLRSSMLQEPLSRLATIACDNRTAMKLKFEAIIGEFANVKAHKVNLL
jgi:hypothetical protein